jgi:hypothetical protein
MQKLLPAFWKQLQTRGIPWAPGLSAAEQTRLTWAKAIEAVGDVPVVYRDFFDPLLVNGDPFPYVVFAPARDSLFHKTTEKLVVHSGREIDILERTEDKFKPHCHPLDKISYVETGTVLLDSYVKISGSTRDGNPNSITIKFNSVTDYLFMPILKAIRLAAGNGVFSQNNEKGKFDHLSRLNFKFMNYAKRSLLAGERVVHFVLQPEIQEPIVKILGWIYHRIISPTHMIILTDRELIAIREEEPKSGVGGKYGGIWDYIPLNKITGLYLTGRDDRLLTLSIHLPEKTALEFLYQASAKPELDGFIDRFHEITAAC